MSLPETCPFCGSEPYTTASGEQCRGGDRWVLFSCDTPIYAGQDLRRTQSRKCEDAERTRLAVRLAAMEARCKRLEEAGDRLEWRIACGCGQGVPCGHCANTLEAWQQAKEAKPCPHCLRVECECSEFDACPDMGDK